MHHGKQFGLVLLAATSFAACVDASEAVSLDETQQEIATNNGVSLNGVSLNGTSLNGVSLNGVSLNGTSLNGISLNGVSLNGVSLNGISLNGISLNGVSLNGTTLQGVVGSTWSGVLSNGTSLALRLDRATTGTDANADVGMFTISYRTRYGWAPLCGREANGTPIQALAVAGTWDPYTGDYTPSDELISFACRGKSVAKCVELGYKPWLGHSERLESCVRLLRADYCGDGTPFTVNGTLLNLYDNAGVQADTEDWEKEAEWTPYGARCISYSRQSRFVLTWTWPHCLRDGTLKALTTCGMNFSYGASLISELPAH